MVNWSDEDHFPCDGYDSLLITSSLKEYVWCFILPDQSKLLKVHNWLRKSMSTDLLGDLTVNVMHAYAILISKTDIENDSNRILTTT